MTRLELWDQLGAGDADEMQNPVFVRLADGREVEVTGANTTGKVFKIYVNVPEDGINAAREILIQQGAFGRIAATKKIREITGLSLMESKKKVDNLLLDKSLIREIVFKNLTDNLERGYTEGEAVEACTLLLCQDGDTGRIREEVKALLKELLENR